MRLPIDPEERSNFVRFVVGFGGLIVLCAVLHAQHLMAVEPRHYTEYHRPLLPLQRPALVAAQYAAIASFGPGMAFGAICFFVCRAGRGERVSFLHVLPFVVALLVAIEALSLGAAGLSRWMFRRGGAPLFPPAVFPELTDGIVYTQSANLALLPASLGLCAIFFLAIRRRRLIG